MAAKKTDDLISPPASLTSPVWKHFKISVDRTFSMCNVCKTKVPYKGNTTNMRTHMTRHHSDIWAAAGSSIPTPSATGEKQASLKTLLQGKMTSTAPKAQAITKAIGQFLVADLRPFVLVESKAFRNLMQITEPRYRVPNRHHFSEYVLPALYSETKQIVLEKLSKSTRVAITSDGWTSKAGQSYVTITCHKLDQAWNLTGYVLQTRLMEESHTGKNIADVLTEAVQEWGIKEKHPALVTDNAANMLVAAREGGFSPHVGCFAHILNLATSKALKLPAVDRILGRVRRIVTFFHRSTTATAILKKKQILLELPQRKLKIDVCTRWNSTYEMIERYLQLEPAVQATLLSPSVKKNATDIITLSDSDNEVLQQLVELLAPFKIATVAICEETSPTISIITPLMSTLRQSATQTEGDSKVMKDMKAALRHDLGQRYSEPEIREVLNLSTAIDPRFKSLPFLSEDERTSTHSTLAVRAAQLQDEVQYYKLVFKTM